MPAGAAYSASFLVYGVDSGGTGRSGRASAFGEYSHNGFTLHAGTTVPGAADVPGVAIGLNKCVAQDRTEDCASTLPRGSSLADCCTMRTFPLPDFR